MSGTKIFQRNRALGHVSNHIPACVRFIKPRKENLVVTCVGRSFHLYASNTFRLISVSGIHSDEITCIASDSYFIYTSCAKTIYTWRHGRILKFELNGHTKNVHLMLPFGKHLISVDEDSCLKIWDLQSETEYLEIRFQNNKFKITAIMHPLTYTNKILLGSAQGDLQLWNVKGCKLVHTFNSFHSEILVLEQAPAVDVTAIGLKDGKIILLNLKYEEKLMEFTQDWGPVTGISFRTDGFSIMATSSTNGSIVFWNLDERKIAHQLKAHDLSVTTLLTLSSEPLLLTTSPDNSIKLWIFDMPDGGPRLLRERQGHAAPPTFIRFHGSNGQNILSAGEDGTLRIFNTVTEQWNKSLGKASYNRKASKKKNRFEEDPFLMPPINKFTTETTREKEWDNIAALHEGLVMATTWSFHKQRMGDLKLVPPKFHNKNPNKDFNAEATSICLTYCGNFVIIGYSTGNVERFNIQSGIHRMSYGDPAHTKTAVRGVAVDQLNQVVVSAGYDGLIKFWNFKSKCENHIQQLEMKYGIVMLVAQRESSMLCIVLEDFSINLIDLDTRTIVRRFKGHSSQITDVCFSPDSRWLISAAMDCSIKVWDIPSSYLIDHFRIAHPCISLTMSPTGQFLATAHSNDVGICLWANKTLYKHISLRVINPDSEPPLIDLPATAQFDTENNNLDEMINDVKLEEGEEVEIKYSSPEQLSDELLTMSTQAASKWQHILNLDIIRKRNKPKEPPKAPKQAPFFLPTVNGPEFQFDLTNVIQDDDQSKVRTSTIIDNTTSFGKMLKATKQTNDFQKCVKYLLNLGPSMVEFEIKSISPLNGGSLIIMEQFVQLILFMLESNLNFEFAQSYLGVFLKYHSEDICTNANLSCHLDKLEKLQNRGWKVLEDNLLYGIGVVNALRNYVL